MSPEAMPVAECGVALYVARNLFRAFSFLVLLVVVGDIHAFPQGFHEAFYWVCLRVIRE